MTNIMLADPRVSNELKTLVDQIKSRAEAAIADAEMTAIKRALEEQTSRIRDAIYDGSLKTDRLVVESEYNRSKRAYYGVPDPTSDLVPFVPDLDERILAIISTPSGNVTPQFAMVNWHSTLLPWGSLKPAHVGWCGTAHCLAGWAIHLAGLDGYALEKALDAEAAGAAIFIKSTESCPFFYSSNEDALREMERRVLARLVAKYAAPAEVAK